MLRVSQWKMLAFRVAGFSPSLRFHVISASLLLYRTDEDRRFFRNNGTLLTEYTALHLEQK